MALKDSWKTTGSSMKDAGVGIGHAFRDLGKSLVRSVKVGAEKADDWASRDDKVEEVPAEEKGE